MHIFLYGSGYRSSILIDLIKNNPKIVIDGIVDSNENKWGSLYKGYVIAPPFNLKSCTSEYVCVTFFGENDYESIWRILEDEYEIYKDRILSFHDLLKMCCHGSFDIHVESCNKEMHKTIFAGAWEWKLGGVENWLLDTVSQLCETENDIFLLSEADGMKSILRGDRIIDFVIKNSCSFEIENIAKSIQVMQDNRPCVCVCSRVDEIMLAGYLLKTYGCKDIRIIGVVHGTCDGIIRDMFSYNCIIDHYACVSNTIRELLIGLGADENKCSVIAPSVNNSVRKTKVYTENVYEPLRIGYAGRLEILHKRADLIIELIKDLEVLGANYVLEIAGYGAYTDNIIKFINDGNLGNKVKYMGMIEHKYISDFWNDKDISINVSDSEGRPLSNIEAMLCGVVPIVTSSQGIKEDVIDGYTGYMVDIGDHMSMAKKIVEIDIDRKILSIIGQNAQKIMMDKLNPQKYKEEWLNMIRGYVNG